MFRFLSRKGVATPTLTLDADGHVKGFSMPTAEEVRDQWSALYTEQSEQLESTVAKLDEANRALEHLLGIENASRHLMDVMDLMIRKGTPVFKLNDEASPAERAAIIDAIILLRAQLTGAELPEFAKSEIVTH